MKFFYENWICLVVAILALIFGLAIGGLIAVGKEVWSTAFFQYTEALAPVIASITAVGIASWQWRAARIIHRNEKLERSQELKKWRESVLDALVQELNDIGLACSVALRNVKHARTAPKDSAGNLIGLKFSRVIFNSLGARIVDLDEKTLQAVRITENDLRSKIELVQASFRRLQEADDNEVSGAETRYKMDLALLLLTVGIYFVRLGQTRKARPEATLKDQALIVLKETFGFTFDDLGDLARKILLLVFPV